MRTSLRVLSVIFLAGLAGVFGACSSSSPSASAPTPAERTPALRPTPAPVVEEQVIPEQPMVESVPSVEVREELPEDLVVLNDRGYLQDVFFETDRYDLSPESREALAKNSAWLQQYSSVRILVEGHCDERNTREYNLALGERRANAVRDYLVFLGVSPNRIQTVSYGEERPFSLGHTEDAWKLNRRSHFVIIAR